MDFLKKIKEFCKMVGGVPSERFFPDIGINAVTCFIPKDANIELEVNGKRVRMLSKGIGEVEFDLGDTDIDLSVRDARHVGYSKERFFVDGKFNEIRAIYNKDAKLLDLSLYERW